MVGGWSRVIQDRYRVDRELGRRGPVSTWLVTNLKSVTPCVLKCLHEAEAPAADARLFEAEARILAGLEHPGLPRLVEYFTEGEGIAAEERHCPAIRVLWIYGPLDSEMIDQPEPKQAERQCRQREPPKAAAAMFCGRAAGCG